MMKKIGSLNQSLKATILKCVGHTYSQIARITQKVIMRIQLKLRQ
ncbi:hypothetical protein HMPREF9412_4327 [Paenibacillus sp. HGF5]|nr:hypothetical protein HMPREF9412_4327 [Paenibacillus sp. HGF5]